MVDQEVIDEIRAQMAAASSYILHHRLQGLHERMASPRTIQDREDLATKRDEMELWIELAEAELADRERMGCPRCGTPCRATWPHPDDAWCATCRRRLAYDPPHRTWRVL